MNGSSIVLLAALNCYGLSADQQAYCQAREHQEVSYCYNIKDYSLREVCRSEVNQTPWNCDTLPTHEQRQLCRNRAGESK
jgi:hypothetical protein